MVLDLQRGVISEVSLSVLKAFAEVFGFVAKHYLMSI